MKRVSKESFHQRIHCSLTFAKSCVFLSDIKLILRFVFFLQKNVQKRLALEVFKMICAI